jgi:hypothetical protein
VIALRRLETAVQESFVVTVRPGRRFPHRVDDDKTLLENAFVVPDEGPADVPAAVRPPTGNWTGFTECPCGREVRSTFATESSTDSPTGDVHEPTSFDPPPVPHPRPTRRPQDIFPAEADLDGAGGPPADVYLHREQHR